MAPTEPPPSPAAALPGIQSHEDVVSSVTAILKHHCSKSRWNYLRSIHPQGFSPSDLSRLLLSFKNRAHLALRLFTWSSRLRRPDLAGYATIIHILARSGLSSHAQSLIRTAIALEEQHEQKEEDAPAGALGVLETLAATYRACDSRPFVFDLLVRTCLASGKTERAIDTVRRLRSRGLRLTIGTSNSLVRHVARSSGADDALRLYREIFSCSAESEGETESRRGPDLPPNVQTFNSLLHAFYCERHLAGVERVVSEMTRLGCEPNLFTYNVLMAAFSNEGRTDKSMELWGQMLEKQMEPDVVSYNTLIGGLCRVGEVARAEELYRRMTIDGGIEPTCRTLESLIEGHCRTGDVDGAILIFRDLRRRGFSPVNDSVNRIVEGLCRKARASEAVTFFRKAVADGGVEPDRSSYETLIGGLCEEGQPEEALAIQVEMASRGFEPDRKVYGFFLRGYEECGNDEKVRKIREEMESAVG
ncbi:Pentatricopeptide repeat-containing protein [Nymphaea thermarum]|nr:Pentatricopeptide repeat-containing protein [Nymphaea thermarum]